MAEKRVPDHELNIPVGISNFAEIRREKDYYIDKTGLIRELLRVDRIKVLLITRPRRFGKTLAMSMLAEFFDIRKSSAVLFERLSISENPILCEQWMNQYPTIFISFRGVDGLNFESAFARMQMCIADLYKEYTCLMDCENISEFDRELFRRIASGTGTKEETGGSLLALTRMLFLFYERPVIILIDEYDVPLAKASEHGYYAEMLDLIRQIMSVCKDNDVLKRAVITGCLRIAKESVFTGTNNFVTDSISDHRLNEYFGFTQNEVDRLLEDKGLIADREQIREWYDGYRFGSSRVYCPWDVMNYVNDLLLKNAAKPKSYWKNSSDNAIIRTFIDRMRPGITQSLEQLLSGETIVQEISEDLSYNDLYTSKNASSVEKNFWSVLYMTGYLTPAAETEPRADGCLRLKIPNLEVREIYESTITEWFSEEAQNADRRRLFSAVWSGDADAITEEMNRLLRRTISYHDYKEDFYHAFFAGIFAGAGYQVQSNREHGEGRSDITVQDYDGSRTAVFEVKYAKDASALQRKCGEALRQMDERMYAEEFSEDYAQIFCYGISFFKKKCLVMKK